jgi:hypothetical protein
LDAVELKLKRGVFNMRTIKIVAMLYLLVISITSKAGIEGEWALYCDSSTNIYNDESGQSKISVLTSQIYKYRL